ncbi:MAG: integrin alpha, partial [Patescibacteria group bacterium]
KMKRIILFIIALLFFMPFSSKATTVKYNVGDFAEKTINSQAGDRTGSQVTWAGDVNGDGYDDLLIGASGANPTPLEYEGQDTQGVVYLFYGPFTANDSIDLEAADVYFYEDSGIGRLVAALGDVNGDGYDDFIIENYLVLGSSSLSGEVMLETDANAYFVSENDCVGENSLADEVSYAGDINNDGYNDILIGWEQDYDAVDIGGGYYNCTANELYYSFLFYGGPSAFSGEINAFTSADVIFTDTTSYTGDVMSGVGDVNGDSYDDFVLAGGKQYLMYGSALLSPTIDLTTQADVEFDTSSTDWYYDSIANIGDLNTDGYDDIIFGSTGYCPDDTTQIGKVYIYLGGPSLSSVLTESDADAYIEGLDHGDRLGVIAPAGDFDQDGYDDYMVGMQGDDEFINDGGAVFLFNGNASISGQILLSEAAIKIQGALEDDRIGNYLSAMRGDANSDGIESDVLIGNIYTGSSDNTGVVYLLMHQYHIPTSLDKVRNFRKKGTIYKWNKVEGKDHYRLVLKLGKKVVKSWSSNKNSLTTSKVKSFLEKKQINHFKYNKRKNLTFKVRAVNGELKGEFSNAIFLPKKWF